MRAKERLIAWAMWRLEPGFSIPSASTPLQRIRDDQENAGASADGFHYDMIGPTDDDPETVAAMPDGGLGDMIDRMAGAIEHDNRCREVNALVDEMRYRARDHWNVVDVTFGGLHPRDVMKGPSVSARILGLSNEDYRTRMRQVYEWMEIRLGLRRAA